MDNASARNLLCKRKVMRKTLLGHGKCAAVCARRSSGDSCVTAICFNKEQPHAIFTKSSLRGGEQVLAQTLKTFLAAGLPDVGVTAEDWQPNN